MENSKESQAANNLPPESFAITTSTQKPPEYRVYPYRQIVTFAFILGSLGNLFQGYSLAPIYQTLNAIYKVGPVVTNLLAYFFYILNTTFSFPANQLLDTQGLAWGFRIGTVLIILGSALKLLVNQSFYYCLASGMLCGIAVPFINNGISKISGNWFKSESRQIITTIIQVSVLLFGTFGQLIPGFMFSDYDVNLDTDDLSIGKSTMFKLFLIMAVITILFEIVGLIFIKSQPKTPPCPSSSIPRTPFITSVKLLLKNKDYLLLVASSCFLNGIIDAVGPILSYLLQPFGFRSQHLSITMVILISSGLIGAFLATKIINKYKTQKLLLQLTAGARLFLTGLWLLSLYLGSFALNYVASAIGGMLSLQSLPLFIELSTELSFPVGEAAAQGLMDMTSVIFTCCLGLLLSYIDKDETKPETLYVFIILWVCIIIGFIFLFFIKIELKKMKADSEKSNSGHNNTEENKRPASNLSTQHDNLESHASLDHDNHHTTLKQIIQ